MVLQQGPAGSALLHALSGYGDRRLPKSAIVAILASIAVHGVIGVYLYTMKFRPAAVAAVEEPPPMVFRQIRLYPDRVQPPVKPVTPLRTHTPTQTPYMTDPSPIPVVEQLKPVITYTPPQVVEQTVPPEQPPLAPKLIGPPRWIAMPSAQQLEAAYPARAAALSRTGVVTLNCLVNAAGTVRECAVASETPAGFGFGEAAVKLSRYFRMQPQTENGQPIDGAAVTIPLRFNLG